MPIAAPAVGITGCRWADEWFKLLQAQGLGAGGCRCSLRLGARGSGAPGDQANSWLKAIGAHSCKRTRDQLVGEAPPEVVENDCGGEDVVSSSEDSADEEQPDRAADELAEAEVLGSWDGRVDISKLKESDIYFRNQLSRVIHTLADEAGNSLTCGRAITTAYERLQERPKVMFPRCKQCFRMLVA